MAIEGKSPGKLRTLLGAGVAVVALAGILSLPGLRSEARASLVVGDVAPDFTLTDVTGKEHHLSDYRGKVVVVEWFNYDCPFVRKHYDSGNMQALQADFTSKGVVWLAVNSTRESHGDYLTPEQTRAAAEKKGASPTALLLDADGTVGRRFDAATTPHLFVVDEGGLLAYQGAIDSVSSTDPDDIPGATNHVRQALDELLAGGPISTRQTKAYGCSVKY